MRLLIDECVDPRVKTLFHDHEVYTVHEMGWGKLTDSELLPLASKSFNVLRRIRFATTGPFSPIFSRP
jgi:predicted nuclease of predicted toxin-antitoxin system